MTKPRAFAQLLLASTAMTAVALAQIALAPVALAQAATDQPAAQTVRTGLGDSQPTDVGKVRATGTRADGTRGTDAGGGLMVEEDAPKSRSTVTRDFIDKQSPTSNPYQLLRMFPGVQQSSTDPFGLNGGNIVIRGLNSDQVGLTIEGAPVNDSGNYALFPQEYIDAENLEQVVLTHGSSDLDSPHIGAVGGTMNLYLRDPLKEAGGFASLSAGSYHQARVFARADTGLIMGTKVRAFLSFSHNEVGHWRGPGFDTRDNLEGKVVGEFGDGNRVSFAFLYNDATNNFYRNPTLAQFQQFGAFGFNYNRTQTSATDNNYYKIQVNPFRNLILSAPSSFNLGSNVTLDVTPYFWYGYGNGGGATALATGGFFDGVTDITKTANKVVLTPGGRTVLYYSPSITQTYRPGVISKVTYNWDNQKIVGGYWFEWANHRQTGPFSPVDAGGNPVNVWGDRSTLALPNGQTLQKRDQLTVTKTNVLFLGDTISLMNDHLFFDVGLKQAFVTRDGTNYIPGTTRNLSLTDTNTLPTAAVRYKLNDQNTVFASVATGFRTPQNFTLFDAYSIASGAKTTAANSSQKSETSFTAEIGHRYQGGLFDTAVSGFFQHFSNRLVSTTVFDSSNSQISSNLNVGGQNAFGIDAEIGLRPIANFRPYVSAELMTSRILDNYAVGTGTGASAVADALPTVGKQAPRTPQVQFAVGIDYDDGALFGNLDGKFVGRQFSTFTNDQAIPAYFTADATIGYHLPDTGVLKAPKVQLNVFNLFDSNYLSGVSSVQTNAAATKGVKGSTIPAGGTPAYYVGSRIAFIVSLSSAF
jgi:iron complex outermembrane receptor protein